MLSNLRLYLIILIFLGLVSFSCSHVINTAHVQGEEDGVPSIKIWDKPNIVRNNAAPINRIRSGKPVKVLKTHKYNDSDTTFYLISYKGEDGKMKGWVSEQLLVLSQEQAEPTTEEPSKEEPKANPEK